MALLSSCGWVRAAGRSGVGRAFALALVGLACELQLEPRTAPQLEAVTFDGHVQSSNVSLAPEIVVQFDRPLRSASWIPSAWGILTWPPTGASCDRWGVCAEGVCTAGQCVHDPLAGPSAGRALRGALDEVEHALPRGAVTALGENPGEGATAFRLVSTALLQPWSRHSLVIAPTVVGADGAPLADGLAPLRYDFVTGGPGRAGPVARFVWPSPGAIDLPTSRSLIYTEFAHPVTVRADDRIALVSEQGAYVLGMSQGTCPGWLDGHCLAWSLEPSFAPWQRYTIAGTTVVDTLGRSAPVVGDPGTIEFGPSTTAARVDARDLRVVQRGHCVILQSPSRAVVDLRAVWHSSSGEFELQRLWSTADELGLEIPASHGAVELELELRDGQNLRSSAHHRLNPQRGVTYDWAISEVLANPAGSEPDDEFIELTRVAKPGPDQHHDLYLIDSAWSELTAQLEAEPDQAPGWQISTRDWPTAIGARVVVISAEHASLDRERNGHPADASVARGARVVVVDGSIAAGGLKNAGEAISLYRMSPPRLISSVTPKARWSELAGGESMLRRDTDGCDVARNWRPSGPGAASPGGGG